IKEDETPPSTGAGVVGGVPGGVPGGSMGGVLGGMLSSTPVAIPKAATPQRVRVSQGVSQGMLIRKDGAIENRHVASGHPMLTGAALEAVKGWRYKPYYLNGEPVEVETTINVIFSLAGG